MSEPLVTMEDVGLIYSADGFLPKDGRTPRQVRLDALEGIVRREVAKALRGVDTDAMAEAWGDGAAWFTTGSHVAEVVRDWLDGDAAEIENGGQS